jgi:hypothetical protein
MTEIFRTEKVAGMTRWGSFGVRIREMCLADEAKLFLREILFNPS